MEPDGSIEKAVIVQNSEKEMAEWLSEQGRKVVCHKGRYWKSNPRGFYQPVHTLARLTAEEATRPAAACWGFRASVSDSAFANFSIPVHLLENIDAYGPQALSARNRNKLRKALNTVEYTRVSDPSLLFEEGYGVFVSARNRTQYSKPLSPGEYRKLIATFFSRPRGLVVGGLVEGKLGGYITSYAVGTTAYLDQIWLASEVLSTNIGLGLFFRWIEACQRSGFVKEIVHGLHARENQGLCRHKADLGLNVSLVPSRAWFMPPTQTLIKWKKPHAYYRLTGRN